MEAITKQLAEAAEELIAVAKAKPGQILVVGCSTSEVIGNKIGTGKCKIHQHQPKCRLP